MIQRKNASLFLVINTLFFGSSYIVSKILLSYFNPYLILFIGSFISLVIMYIYKVNKKEHLSKEVLLQAFLLGIISFSSQSFCMLSLKNTSSSNTAFILQSTVIIVPLINRIFFNKKLTKKNITSAILCLGGIYFITDIQNTNISIGDIYAFLNAIFFSIYLIFSERLSKKHKATHIAIPFHATCVILYFICFMVLKSQINQIPKTNILLYLLLLISSLTILFTQLIQTAALKFIKSSKAAIIYVLEPVTTLILSITILKETQMTYVYAFGCLLIVSGIIYQSSINYLTSKLKFHAKKIALLRNLR